VTLGTSKEELIDRAELVAKAEEQAAIAESWRILSERATPGQLLGLPVVAEAMQYTAQTEAAACERWALEAEREGDVLLARALHRLAEDLLVVSAQAAVVGSEAKGFGDIADD